MTIGKDTWVFQISRTDKTSINTKINNLWWFQTLAKLCRDFHYLNKVSHHIRHFVSLASDVHLAVEKTLNHISHSFPHRLHSFWRVHALHPSNSVCFTLFSGQPPYPIIANLSTDELEYITRWLDHYHVGPDPKNPRPIIGFLKEFKDQQDHGSSTFKLPEVPKWILDQGFFCWGGRISAVQLTSLY